MRKAQDSTARAGLTKRITSHAFSPLFTTQPRGDGHDIRTLQALLGHADVSTTEMCTHVLNRGGHGAQNLLDR